jgi:hypothetical protein
MKDYKLRKGTTQWRFNKSRHKIQIFAGGFGNGKTTSVVIKGLQIAKDYPYSSGLVARETYPKLNDTIRKEFYKWTPPDWVKKWPTQEDNSMHLINGTTIHFRYIAQRGKNQEDGSTTSNLLSAAYDWIIVDQIEDPGIGYKDFLDLLGRLRGDAAYQGDDETMPDTGPRFFMITLNPSRTWIYKKVVWPYIQWKEHGIFLPDLIIDPDTKEPMLDVFQGPTRENAENLAPDFIKTMEAAYKGQMRERFLEGNWVAFEGLVHPHFDSRVHGISRKQAEDHLNDCLARHVKVRAIESYDFGVVSPSCYMLGFVDDHGRVVILDGFYSAEFDYSVQPAAIREIRNRYIGRLEIKRRIIADPAIFRKQVVAQYKGGTSIAELMNKLGIFMEPGGNDVLAGIAKVNSYLSEHPKMPHLVTGKAPGPLLYIVNDLGWFEDEIGGYYWKKNPLGIAVDEPVDHNDHAMNATKYMLSHLPDASKIVLPANERPKPYLLWHEMEVKDYRKAVRV